MAKLRTLNIQASYFKKVGLKHCMMKARNALKKIGRDRDSDVNRGGIAGLREKKTRGKMGFENPIVDPQQLLSNLNFILYN